MAEKPKEELEILEQKKAKLRDLIYDVANMRKEYSERCTNIYSKILEKEHEQLVKTKLIITRSGSSNILSSKNPLKNTNLDHLFPNKTFSVDDSKLLQKMDELIEDAKKAEEAASVIDQMLNNNTIRN